MVKNLGIAIALSAIMPGMGHIYLGMIKRGLSILIAGIILIITWIFVPRFVPYPYGWILVIAYWIWQIADVRRLFRKKKFEFGVS